MLTVPEEYVELIQIQPAQEIVIVLEDTHALGESVESAPHLEHLAALIVFLKGGVVTRAVHIRKTVKIMLVRIGAQVAADPIFPVEQVKFSAQRAVAGEMLVVQQHVEWM